MGSAARTLTYLYSELCTLFSPLLLRDYIPVSPDRSTPSMNLRWRKR